MRGAILVVAAGTLGALLGFAPGVRAQAQERRVTLDEAVRLSLAAQPAMVQARGDVRTASAASRSSWAAFLPSLSTNAAASRGNKGRIDQTTGQFISPQYTYTVGFGASLELFDGFRRLAQKKAADAQLDAADAGLVQSRFATVLATQQAFYDAAAREELVRVAEAQLDRARRQLTDSIDRLHAGTATRSDSLRAVLDLGNARIALLQAQSDLASSQADLGRQIGAQGPVAAQADTILAPPPEPSLLPPDAADSAPEVAQSDAQASAARAQVWSARSQYWPSLTLSYSHNYQGQGSPFSNFGEYDETFNWRFGLSWTIFNGFQREGNQVQASVARANAEANAAETRRRVAAQLAQDDAAVRTAYDQIDIARTNVAAAEEDLRVQTERYQLGASTILDLMTSQVALTQAQANLIQTRFNYRIARARLEALVGREL
jgi:outer membrane protein